MPKEKIIYECTHCGGQSVKYSGKCFDCGEWNTMKELKQETKSGVLGLNSVGSSRTIYSTSQLNTSEKQSKLYDFDFSEIKRVFGDGIISDGYYILAGEPGIGKSTLILQFGERLAQKGAKVLIISGEETVSQVGKRMVRLGCQSQNLFITEIRSFPDIVSTIEQEKPDIVFIDSIQVIHHPDATGASGNISQVRTIGEALLEVSKKNNIAVFLLAHVTKDGSMAGPKTLEHVVDVVLQFEGDRKSDLRFIRCVKNRFGPTDEVGILQMTAKGLVPPPNLVNFLIPHFKDSPVGVAHSIVLEGKRPIPVEVQALTVPTHFGYPSRTISGYDKNRIQTILAILEKYANIKFSDTDVYISFTGGVKVTDIACDLAICMALLSSKKGIKLKQQTFYAGEVTLTGMIHKPLAIEKRQKFIEKILNSSLITDLQVKEVEKLLNLLT